MILKIKDVNDLTIIEVEKAIESGEVNLIIDSFGGDLFAGFKIYELLRNTSAKVSAKVEGKCYSAATVILLGVKPENRSASPLSTFMIHSPLMTVEEGTINLSEAEQQTEDIRIEFNRLLDIYKERLSIGEEEIRSLMLSEKTFDVNKALELGFISRIENYLNKMKKNKNWIAKMFQRFINEAESVELEDGTIVEVSELPLKAGVLVDLEDGVYVTKAGDVLTVEAGVIVDYQPKEQEEEVIENEGEETPEEEAAEVEQVAEEVIPELEEKIEEIQEAETVEELEEVAEEIEDVIEEAVISAVEEVMAKFGKAYTAKKKKVCNKAPKKKMVNKSAKRNFQSIAPKKEIKNEMSREEMVKKFWK